MLKLSPAVIEVLGHAEAGRSLFTGYDKGLFAGTPELGEAYLLREGAIASAVRQRLLTERDHTLTAAGRVALTLAESR